MILPAQDKLKTEPVAEAVYDVKQLAYVLKISTRQVWRLTKDGTIPPPISLGHAKRWSRAEIAAWLRAGAPAMNRWLEIRADYL